MTVVLAEAARNKGRVTDDVQGNPYRLAAGVVTTSAALVADLPPDLVAGFGGLATGGVFLVAQVANALRDRGTARRMVSSLEMAQRWKIFTWLQGLLALLGGPNGFSAAVKGGRIAIWRRDLVQMARSAESFDDPALRCAVEAVEAVLLRVDSFPQESFEKESEVLLRDLATLAMFAARPPERVVELSRRAPGPITRFFRRRKSKSDSADIVRRVSEVLAQEGS